MFEQLRESVAGLICRELVERRNHFERLANTDALTGLPNRAAFDLAVSAANTDENFHFIIFDANNFKLVNKKSGHASGDRLLKKYANCLARAARAYSCRAFRLGGDEFVIICRQQFVEKIRDAVERHAEPIDFGDFTVSLSGETGATLEEADAKLQSRKRARKAQDRSGDYYLNTNKEQLVYAN